MANTLCGASIMKSDFRVGVAGCLVSFVEAPGKVYALTAAHVVADLSSARGQPILLQGPPPTSFGKLYSWSTLDGAPTVDAALIEVDPATVSPEIAGFGFAPNGFNGNPAPGDPLRLVSIRQPGVVVATQIDRIDTGPGIPLSWTGPDGRETVPYVGQIVCVDDQTIEGDSGAMVLDPQGRLVGMVVGSLVGDDGSRRTVVTPIAAIRSGAYWYNRTLQLVGAPAAPAPAPQALLAAHAPGAPSGRGSFGIDSLDPVSQPTLESAQKTLGRLPLYWGRYFHAPGRINAAGGFDEGLYAPAEGALLRKNQIRLLPLARQTVYVGEDQATGRAQAGKNVAALFEAFPPAYLQGADASVLLFLDVEGADGYPSLASDYYVGWASGVVDAAAAASNGAVKVLPAVYGRTQDASTWQALVEAMGQGAPCYGLWTARLPSAAGQPRDWDDTYALPAMPGPSPPVLVWQYAQKVGPIDTDQTNPAHDDVLMGGAIMPPS